MMSPYVKGASGGIEREPKSPSMISSFRIAYREAAAAAAAAAAARYQSS